MCICAPMGMLVLKRGVVRGQAIVGELTYLLSYLEAYEDRQYGVVWGVPTVHFGVWDTDVDV